MDQPKTVLSFGFSKIQEVRNLSKSAISETTEKLETEKDFVLSVEGKEVQSTKPCIDKKEKDYVIPLIKQNNWRLKNLSNNSVGKNLELEESLDTLAAKEILQESAKYNENWEERGNENTTLSIPLLMQNKIPDGFESEDKLDVALRPDEPDEADYEKIPIEQYGLAMLRGMGWNQEQGIGKKAKVVVPIEAHLRPKGMGLGADKSNSASKKKVDVFKTDQDEVLELKKNSFCVVTSGVNKDLYGTIEGLDEDNARVVVKLALNGKSVNIMQSYIKLVGKKEYEKYSKYLNKAKADKYKEEETKAIANGYSDQEGNNERNSKHKHKKHKNRDKEDIPNPKRRKHSKDNDKHYSEQHNDKKNKNKKNKSRHYSTDSSSSNDESSNTTNSIIPWLRNDLKVRIIDKSLKKGKFYNQKVVIVDVPSVGHCICKTEDGTIIDNVHQSSLETIVPKGEDAYIAIVSGTNRGLIGQILKRQKDKCLAIVQLLSDRDNLLKLHYDEICHYVGNVYHHSDY